MARLILLLLLVVCCSRLFAQERTTVMTEDSLFVESQDTLLIQSYAKRYDPRRALLFAAIFPGLGQIYNKKYWKLPLVYGGFYATGYALNLYNQQHREYRNIVFRALENGVREDQIRPDLGMRNTLRAYRIAVDRAKRERDFMIIIMGVVYVLQIVDAHVDAHLKEFDLNPNLQVSIEPLFEQNPILGRQSGASLVFRF